MEWEFKSWVIQDPGIWVRASQPHFSLRCALFPITQVLLWTSEWDVTSQSQFAQLGQTLNSFTPITRSPESLAPEQLPCFYGGFYIRSKFHGSGKQQFQSNCNICIIPAPADIKASSVLSSGKHNKHASHSQIVYQESHIKRSSQRRIKNLQVISDPRILTSDNILMWFLWGLLKYLQFSTRRRHAEHVWFTYKTVKHIPKNKY